MKYLFAILITIINPLAQAKESKVYTFESVSCISKEELSPEVSLELESEFDLLVLADDNSTIELQVKQTDSQSQKVSYKLNQMSKTAYMAIPEVATSGPNNFSVTIDIADRSEIEVSRQDYKHCGGRLLIKTFVLENTTN